MRCVIGSFPSNPRIIGGVIISVFPDCFAALLENRLDDFRSSVTALKERDESIFQESEKFQEFKNEEKTNRGKLLISMAHDWYHAHPMAKSNAKDFSELEMGSIIRKCYSNAFRNQAWNWEWNQDVSLFLGLITVPQIEHILQPDSHICKTLDEMNEKFPKFLKWLNYYARKCVFSVGPYTDCSRVATFQYFLFELLRRGSTAFSHLWCKYGWETLNPAEDIWELWKLNLREVSQNLMVPTIRKNPSKEERFFVESLEASAEHISLKLKETMQRLHAADIAELLLSSAPDYKMFGWDAYLDGLFKDWGPTRPIDKPTKQEVASVIATAYDTAFESDAWNFDGPEDLSLFLSVATPIRLQETLGLEHHIIQAMEEIQQKFPKFLQWIDDRANVYIPPPRLHYSTLVAFRYFVFEFLRRYPAASKQLAATFGWESENPGVDTWSVWQKNSQAPAPAKKRRHSSLLDALRAGTSVKFKDVWEQMEQDSHKPFVGTEPAPDQNLGWDAFLNYLFGRWQQSWSLNTMFSEEESVSIASIIYDHALYYQAWNFGWTEDISLFLSATTGVQIQGNQGLENHVLQTMNEIQQKFPEFLKWMDARVAESILSDPRNYASVLACRFFMFEFLRLRPAAALHLGATLGWDTYNPPEDIWKTWQQNLMDAKKANSKFLKMIVPTPVAELKEFIQVRKNSDITTPIFEACKKALANSNETEGKIPLEMFQLFCDILKYTPCRSWKERIVDFWEAIMSADENFFEAISVEAQPQDFWDCSVERWLNFVRTKPRQRDEFYKVQSTIGTEWSQRIWPKLLETFRPAKWNSADWLLILAVASVNWEEITHDQAWIDAAADLQLFWDMLSDFESLVFPKERSSVLERAAFRYFILRSLSKRESIEFKEYGVVWTNQILQHMWESTVGTEVAQTTEPSSDLSEEPFAFVTRQQFRNLMTVAYSFVQREWGKAQCATKEVFIKCVNRLLEKSDSHRVNETYARRMLINLVPWEHRATQYVDLRIGEPAIPEANVAFLL
eukprot:Gregarina_sp_Poly_1__10789@NODE_82_length_15568_cov_98_251403_g70_i0_p2_GENE_NODE_82_length_15568_cov_98_251403_g70_i0NODE_82_length_15568_cov_98_251403_g70_i0_p2_ORF_typecomplete_len1018_score155_48Melibiase_2/PF16499_5/5_5e02Melibiase_2/PF16499_5/0_077_NODE_82_length_15568_cov_98_251403_g70_i03123365